MGRREQRAKRMAGVIARWRQSGLSASRFAEESGVPEARLWYWKRRGARQESAPAFVPLQILPQEAQPASSSFELRFPDGRILLIPAGLAGRPLRQLLVTLLSC